MPGIPAPASACAHRHPDRVPADPAGRRRVGPRPMAHGSRCHAAPAAPAASAAPPAAAVAATPSGAVRCVAPDAAITEPATRPAPRTLPAAGTRGSRVLRRVARTEQPAQWQVEFLVEHEIGMAYAAGLHARMQGLPGGGEACDE